MKEAQSKRGRTDKKATERSEERDGKMESERVRNGTEMQRCRETEGGRKKRLANQ